MGVKNRRRMPFFHFDFRLHDEFGKRMGPEGIAVYWSLVRHAADNEENRHTNIEHIARDIGSDISTVESMIDRLVQLKLITVEDRKTSVAYLIQELPD